MARSGPDRRPTLTLKGAEFTPEFRALLNKAAKRKGITQAAFAADVLAAAARRVLAGGMATDGDQGAPSGTPQDNPPDHPLPVPDKPLADLAARQQASDEQIRDLAGQIAEMNAKLQELTTIRHRSIWSRLRGR